MGSNKMMMPSEVRFTQDSIAGRFMDGTYLSDTFEELLYGRLDVMDIPCIEVAYKDGAWWAVTGNRRLYLFRRLQELGVVSKIPVKQCGPSRRIENMFDKRMTTQCDGTSIDVRQPGALKKINNIEQSWKRSRANVRTRQSSAKSRPSSTQPTPARSNHPVTTINDDDDFPPTFIYPTIQPRSASQRSANISNNILSNTTLSRAGRESSYIQPTGNIPSTVASVHHNGSISRSSVRSNILRSGEDRSIVSVQPSVWVSPQSQNVGSTNRPNNNTKSFFCCC